MALIRKRGKRWQAQIFKLNIRKSETFDRKAEAVAWAHKIEADIESARYGPASTATFAEAAARYAEEVSPTKRTGAWESTTLAAIVRRAEFSDWPIIRIRPEDIGRYRDSRSVSASSIRREIILISSVFEQARKEWRMIEVNPCRDVRKPPMARPRTRLPTDDEIERICLALGYDESEPITTKSQQIAIAWLLAIETAMRAGEMLSLAWSQVDIPRRTVRLERTKNGDAREVPLSPRAVDLLMSLRPVDRVRCFTLCESTRANLFGKAVKAARADGLHFHDSRALAITRLSKKFEPLELAASVGHRDMRSLMIYYRESAESRAKKLA